MTPEYIRTLAKKGGYSFNWQEEIFLAIADELGELNFKLETVLEHFRINSDDTPPHGQG